MKREINPNQEMYLVTVARLADEASHSHVPIAKLADALGISVVSTNQMVRKLAEDGYLHYQPYKGVSLLPEGERIARQVLRRRRLWEILLVEHLNLDPLHADALVCELEHITPEEVAEHLSDYLSVATLADDSERREKVVEPSLGELLPLASVETGQVVEVVAIHAPKAIKEFMELEDIVPGSTVTVHAVNHQGAMLLQCGEHYVNLDAEITRQVWVKGGT